MNRKIGSSTVTVKQVVAVAGCIFLAMTGLVMATTYVWDTPSSGAWEVYTNWNSIFCSAPCYPDSASDDALIVRWASISIADDHTIDDLTLAGMEYQVGSEFTTSAQTPPTITCEMLEITDSSVYLRDEVTIIADD